MTQNPCFIFGPSLQSAYMEKKRSSERIEENKKFLFVQLAEKNEVRYTQGCAVVWLCLVMPRTNYLILCPLD